MKMSAIAVVLMIGLIAVWTGNASAGIPDDAVKYAIGKIDGWFSCSRYDGFAACWHNDWKKRDKICGDDQTCARKDRWDYKFWAGGMCYCCKC